MSGDGWDALLDRDRIRRLFDLRSSVYDSRGGSYAEDPYPTFNRLRQIGPVHPGIPHEALGWTGDVYFQGLPYPGRPHFSAYDFDTCSTVFKDEQFRPSDSPQPGEPMLDAGILTMHGRRHRSYRTLVQPSFVPGRAVWWLDRWIATTVDRLIDAVAGDTRVDLNTEFCAPIPLLTITGSFGISVEEALDVRAAVTSDGQGGDVLARLLVPIIAARRAEPADDLITVLTQAEMTDEDGQVHTLSDEEILAFAFLLLAAGSGTTWKQMGITIVSLLRHPEAQEAAKEDPSFLRGVIEESVRWMPTDPVFARFAVEEVELGGVTIPQGSVVHACLAAANRDPARWEEPDRFDPFRPLKPHLGFGHGPHTCLGMHVAKTEMNHGIRSLLERLPDLRLDPDAPPPRMIGLYERGPDSVPVRFGPAA